MTPCVHEAERVDPLKSWLDELKFQLRDFVSVCMMVNYWERSLWSPDAHSHMHAHTDTYVHLCKHTYENMHTHDSHIRAKITLHIKRSLRYYNKSSRMKYWTLVLTRWSLTMTILKGREYAFLTVNMSSILKTNVLIKYFQFFLYLDNGP